MGKDTRYTRARAERERTRAWCKAITMLVAGLTTITVMSELGIPTALEYFLSH